MFSKSKKTATDRSRKLNASLPLQWCRAGVLLFLLIFAVSSLPACDMTAFVQSEFGERCQLLLELCEKAYLARRLAHPDIDAYNGAMSREWVRFFLAHGTHANVPPSLTFIASDSWSFAMNEIGNTIACASKTGIDKSEMNRLRLRIKLIKEPQRIEVLQKVFAARQLYLVGTRGLSGKRDWVEQALLIPANALHQELEEVPELLQQLQTEVNSHLETFNHILEQESNGIDQEIVAALFSSLQTEIELDMSFWQKLFYYST